MYETKTEPVVQTKSRLVGKSLDCLLTTAAFIAPAAIGFADGINQSISPEVRCGTIGGAFYVHMRTDTAGRFSFTSCLTKGTALTFLSYAAGRGLGELVNKLPYTQ